MRLYSRVWALSTAIRQWVDQDAAPIGVLVAMPLLLSFFGQEWIYTPIGTLDPWYNVGFFLSYQDGSFLTNHYKVQRLPWIIPGWILYHSLGPIIANYVLHVGALVISTIFVYLTLARLVARPAAFLISALLTMYVPFQGSGGWDYQTAGAGAYFAVALYLVVRAGQASNPKNALIASGVAIAAAVFATIQVVNLLPVLAALYFASGVRRFSWKDARIALAFGAFGFLGLTLALCMVNFAVGRDFVFFWPLLQIVLERVGDPSGQAAWHVPLSRIFVPSAAFFHLILPGVVLIATVLRLFGTIGGIWPLSRSRTWLLGQYLFAALLWIAWQELGHTALHPSYFAHPLIVPAFLALAGLLSDASSEDTGVPLQMLVGGLILACIPLVQSELGPYLVPTSIRVPGEVLVASIALAVVTLSLSRVLLRRPKAAGLALLAPMFLVFTYLEAEAVSFHPQSVPESVTGRYRNRNQCVSNARAYREIIRIFDMLQAERAGPGRALIWRGPAGARTFPSGCIFDLNSLRGSVHSAGVNNLGFETDTHPSQIPDDYVASVAEGGVVMAIVQNDADTDGLIERLSVSGRALTLVRREAINLGKVPLVVLIYRSEKALNP